jgi:hypothetical protein
MERGGGRGFRVGRRGMCMRIMRKRGIYSMHNWRKDEGNICQYM